MDYDNVGDGEELVTREDLHDLDLDDGDLDNGDLDNGEILANGDYLDNGEYMDNRENLANGERIMHLTNNELDQLWKQIKNN